MSPTERILSALVERECNPRQNGKGWTACCPAHDDRRPSLSVSEGDDGRALVRCHAGCATDAICAAVGLRVVDLMPTADSLPPKPIKTNGKPATTYETANETVAALERKHGSRSAQWIYRDAQGDPVGVVVRWDLPDGKKDIRPVSKHADGWRIGGMTAPRPLYDLPGLAGAERVYVVEGEKSADAARSIGLTATTSAHGSQSPDKTDWTPLAGKQCVILPDNDEPGSKYSSAVAAILGKLTPPATVKIVELPGLAAHEDIWNWIDAHSDAAEPAELRQQVEALAEEAGTIQKPSQAESEPQWGPVMTCFADIEPRQVNWLWPGRIAAGRINVACGIPGIGKSFLSCDIASRISTATPWPDGSACPKGSVIIISAEDDPHDTIRPRLDAHRADVSRIHLLSAVRHIREGDSTKEAKTVEMVFTLADVDALELALKQIPDCRLIVIDPIGSYLGGRTDAHRDNEVRAVLAPIAHLAERYGPAVLIVAHRRKSAANTADDMVLGSRAFTGIARCVWHLTRDAENANRRLFLPGKNNLAAQQSGLALSIAGEPAYVTWERDPVDMSADDALVAERDNHGPEAETLAAAKDWLQSALADGHRLANELNDEWKNGQGGSKRTLERAKQALGVEAFRIVVPGPWNWKLPDKTANDPQGEQLGGLGGLAKTSGKLADFGVSDSKDAKLSGLGNLGPTTQPDDDSGEI